MRSEPSQMIHNCRKVDFQQLQAARQQSMGLVELSYARPHPVGPRRLW
jgi:hypothetical protein